MKLVIITGSGAVGKMTVGQALMRKTGLRLFHNHMMIEPVIEIFGQYNGKAINRLREVIFEEFLASDCEGLIFTYMWAFDRQEDWDYIQSVAKRFEVHGAEIYCVELIAPQNMRLQRNNTENRLAHKASKRNLDFSSNCILHEDSNYRLVSREGEIPFSNYIRIDNSNLSPDDAADMIIAKFHFQTSV